MKKHYEKPVIEAVELDRQVVAMLGSQQTPRDSDDDVYPGDDYPSTDPFGSDPFGGN